jgi:HK97 family phage major capsid protein
MSAPDALLAGYQSELEEKSAFQAELAAGAQSAGRDMTSEELELYNRANARMTQLETLMAPLREGARIAVESRARMADLTAAYSAVRTGVAGDAPVEYRSAGQYVADVYYGALGAPDAQQRLAVYNRAAAHQVLADNPGLLPVTIVEPVVNLVDAARPIVSAIGPTDLGTGAWAYARVTQHTLVAQQTAEKAEMASRKMTVTTTPITAPTLGGYVNVSKQNISRTTPQILDMVIADLATEYAIESEKACGAALIAGSTADGTIASGANGDAVAKVLWGAAAAAYNGMRGSGRLVLAVSPDMLGLIGPLFAPVNPTNAQGSGFAAGSFGQGAMGAISGISVVMSAGLPASTILVINTAAVRVFEMRYGAMQVNEPSVWGVQVGYAGDFQTVVIEPTGVQKVTATP